MQTQEASGPGREMFEENTVRGAELEWLVARAKAALESGRPAAAESICRICLEASPDFRPARDILGRVALGAGKPAIAARLFESGDDNGDPEAMFAAGEAALALGNTARALDLFRTLAEDGIARQRKTAGLAALKRLQQQGFSPSAVLDIGAHNGIWAIQAKSVFPAATFTMIEAQAAKADRLRDVAAALGDDAAFHIAVLGAAAGTTVFHQTDYFGDSTGSSIYAEATNVRRRPVTLPMHRLDDLLADDPRRYALIKLDVQGAEIDVLRGATARLRDAEVLQLEIAVMAFNAGAPLAAAVIAFLDQAGFQIYDVVDLHRWTNARLFQFDALFVRREHRLARAPLPPLQLEKKSARTMPGAELKSGGGGRSPLSGDRC